MKRRWMVRWGWVLALTCLPAVQNLALATEIALFKRINDPVRPDVTPAVPFSVWEIDAPDRLTVGLQQQYHWIETQEQLARVAPHIKAALDKSAVRRAMLHALIAQTKVAQYGLARLPAAVLIDDRGRVLQRVYDFDSVSVMLQKMGYR